MRKWASAFAGERSKWFRCRTSTRGSNHDLRAARLSLRAGSAVRSHQALRYDHPEALGEARDSPGRVLDDTGRAREQRPDLLPQMGIARRTRGEDGEVRRRSRMALGAGRDREERAD